LGFRDRNPDLTVGAITSRRFAPGGKNQRLSRGRKNFFDELSISVRPFDYMVKAGQPARKKNLFIESLIH
jgi:hypothetical protein